jgi:NhaP-type Na+/H+ or K+/H+ antiporter
VHEQTIIVVAGVLAGGVAAQWLGWRLRLPPVVLLLVGGLVAGPVTGALDPDEVFGDLLFPGVSLAVAVVLFEGALGLGGRGVREAGTTVWLLLTVGMAVTLVGTTLLARFVLDVEWSLAALVAAVLVVTGPTVIGPIVRAIGLRGRLAAILEAEGTLIDPIGAILAVLTFEAAFHTDGDPGQIAGRLLMTGLTGTSVGLAFAAVLVVALARYVIPDELHNATTLAAVIAGYATANAINEEAGLVAVTVMGIALASQSWSPVDHVLRFNETLRIVFISGLFVLLGARIEAETLRDVEWRNVAFLAALVLLVRPVAVLVSTLRSSLSGRERLFLALTAPRGIVAAAVASVFSLRLGELGVANSQVLMSATFTVIAGTVLLSGLGSRAIATRLGLVRTDRGTVVVLGANPFARELASSLEQHGTSVRMIDLDRRELALARMTGLQAHRGSVLAGQTWEAAGIDSAECFLAVSRNDELNVLAARHAAAILGRRNVFQLPPSRNDHDTGWMLRTGTFARQLFGADTTIDTLETRLLDGWRVRGTRVTDKFGPEDHARTHPEAIPLFVLGSDGRVHTVAADGRRRPRAGDTLVTLGPETTSGAAPADEALTPVSQD